MSSLKFHNIGFVKSWCVIRRLAVTGFEQEQKCIFLTWNKDALVPVFLFKRSVGRVSHCIAANINKTLHANYLNFSTGEAQRSN